MVFEGMEFPGASTVEEAQGVLADLRRRSCVLLDFDGTLADTKSAIVATAREVLLGWGMDEEEIGDASRLVGPPFPDAFSEVYGLSAEDADEVCRRYRAIAEAQGPEAYPPFPGAVEALEALVAAGKRLCLTTSKRQELAASMVGDIAMAPYLETVVGNDGHGRATKDLVVADSVKELGVTPDDAVMVGDRFYDVVGAAVAGVPCVAVDQGTAAPGELAKAGAKVIIDAIAHLPAVLLG